MLDQVIPLVTSPWIYLVVFLVVAVDAFFPAVPSEAIVVGVSAFAAQGDPAVVGLVVAAALGAFAGDSVSYGLGRHALGSSRFLRARAMRAAHEWAGRSSTATRSRASSPGWRSRSASRCSWSSAGTLSAAVPARRRA